MNQQQQFDPRRSDAIRSLVIEAVEATSTSPHRPRRRTLVAMTIAVIAAVLASGSVALALGGQTWFGSPEPTVTPTQSQTPTPTPSKTPTPTPTPTATQAAMPQSIIPAGCSTLLPPGPLGDPMADATLGGDSVEPFTPYYASVLQSGVLSCQWYANVDSEGGLLTLYVSADADAGTAHVQRMIADGARQLALGDSSAVTCSTTGECQASVVVGAYWLDYTLRLFSQTADGQAVATIEQAGSSFVSALQQNPTPLPEWVPPASPWASASTCESITPDVPMSEIVGSPELVGPTVPEPGTTPALVQEARAGLTCRWSVPDGFIAPEGQIRSLEVQIAPGTGWVSTDDVFASADSTPTDVAGADEASFRCVYSEGELCWLDVFVDNSWMQIGYADYTSPDNAPALRRAAEAIIATRDR